MNQEDFNKNMMELMMKEHEKSYNQGITDTLLSIQKSLKSIEHDCYGELSYQIISDLINNIMSEKIYKNNIKEVK